MKVKFKYIASCLVLLCGFNIFAQPTQSTGSYTCPASSDVKISQTDGSWSGTLNVTGKLQSLTLTGRPAPGKATPQTFYGLSLDTGNGIIQCLYALPNGNLWGISISGQNLNSCKIGTLVGTTQCTNKDPTACVITCPVSGS